MFISSVNQKKLKRLYNLLFFILILFFNCKKEFPTKIENVSKENSINYSLLNFDEIYFSTNNIVLNKWSNYMELKELIDQFNIKRFDLIIENKNYMKRFFNGLKNTVPDILNQPEIISRMTVIETNFMKFESLISKSALSEKEKENNVKKINKSFSNLNFQIDKVIEKQKIIILQ